MARVIWLPDAIATIEAVRGYISQFNVAAADRLAVRLVAAGESLATFPNRGRRADDGFRELVIVEPYVIRYWVEGTTIYIARIKHGSQRR